MALTLQTASITAVKPPKGMTAYMKHDKDRKRLKVLGLVADLTDKGDLQAWLMLLMDGGVIEIHATEDYVVEIP